MNVYLFDLFVIRRGAKFISTESSERTGSGFNTGLRFGTLWANFIWWRLTSGREVGREIESKNYDISSISNSFCPTHNSHIPNSHFHLNSHTLFVLAKMWLFGYRKDVGRNLRPSLLFGNWSIPSMRNPYPTSHTFFGLTKMWLLWEEIVFKTKYREWNSSPITFRRKK